LPKKTKILSDMRAKTLNFKKFLSSLNTTYTRENIVYFLNPNGILLEYFDEIILVLLFLQVA